MDALTKELEDFELKKAAARAVTGVLASHPNSTDVHIINLSLTFHGQELLSDTKLELNSGRRYGLIGLNGIGKLRVSSVAPWNSVKVSAEKLGRCRWELLETRRKAVRQILLGPSSFCSPISPPGRGITRIADRCLRLHSRFGLCF